MLQPCVGPQQLLQRPPRVPSAHGGCICWPLQGQPRQEAGESSQQDQDGHGYPEGFVSVAEGSLQVGCPR